MLNEFVKRSSLERTRQMPASEKMKWIHFIPHEETFEFFALFKQSADLSDGEFFHGRKVTEDWTIARFILIFLAEKDFSDNTCGGKFSGLCSYIEARESLPAE